MTDEEKQQLAKSIKARYGKRLGFKNLFNRANREIYKVDILQPGQRQYRDAYKQSFKIKEATDRTLEQEAIQNQKELDKIYQSKSKSLTLEQKTLREVHQEHPTMLSEEDVIRWTK